MKGRTIWLALVVGALAVAAMTAGGSLFGADRSAPPTTSPSGSRSTRSPVGRMRSRPRTSSSRSDAPRLERDRAVPELARPPAEVRRDARGEHGARRHRDGEHRDDEVHGRRRVRGPDVEEVVVRELEQLAQGPRGVGRVQRQDLRRAVLRGLARRDVPHRPLQEGRHQEAADEPRRVHGGRAEARREEQGARPSRRSTSRAPTGTSRWASSTTSAAGSRRRSAASGSARSTARPR